ncbi:alpha-xenorhabdolysin family binary toxin subunit A [Pseudomonas serboccidentalis]|uniref:Alpha-xenorhabdolysin family binary toxin subunit A n=1 Tax=Pseudomonas serboccidentalis TaxID=2964670 RepID=A0ABY7Z9G5_9PSED|nr:alpha-xenorhabdolysin family binary toxin subunit A [Pseudomonas serboccidentalis]WDR36249.1 alpha-xenorhabdolysin family binary toxin subunit A [Pseudomonas serboccidentalis]
MELKLNDKVVEAAANAPLVFVNASLGAGEEYNRGTGIQLTKEQIISLRKYEVLGLSLPVRLQDVVAYLNYGAGDEGGVGLKALDFLRTFSMTYDHAKRWSPLREKIMLTGTDLKIFSGSIIRTGNAIVEVYEDLRASRYLEEHNINTPEEYLSLKRQMPGLPELELSSDDILDIKAYLNDLLAKVANCHQGAERVRAELDSFGTDMREKVLPEIALRLQFVSRNTYQNDIKTLQEGIDQRANEIDELNKQYDLLVQEAIKAAATLNIGGLILGIYQGVKAEKIRSERNRLKQLQQVDNQSMASKNQTLSSLNKIRDDLQNLSYVAIEAEVATQNLMLVWNALGDYVEASVKEVDGIFEATSLRRFKNQLLNIIDPWEQIKVSSDQLLKVFEEADKDYERSGLVVRSRSMMSLLSVSSAVPAFNITRLREHNASVQGFNTTAQMLFEQFDYMPGTVGTMNNLALAVNKATYDLRSQAQATGIYLERAEKKLRSYQAELEYPEDADEVREDMEVELKNIFNKVSVQTEDLKAVHKSISAHYDRSASAEWVVTLKAERATTVELKVTFDEKLAGLAVEMKSVSEGIDLIAKAGIEKIGEQVQLSLENIKALGLAPPQVQVVLLAIDTLKKMISGIGEAISFLNMLAAYNRLNDKAGDLRTQINKYIKDIARIDGRIELVETLDQLDDGRAKYAGEFSILIDDFTQFASDFRQNTSLPVETRAQAAIVRVAEVVKHLKSIHQ